MKEDQRTLASSEVYDRNRNDEEQNGIPRDWRKKTEEPREVCLIYSLSALVILFAVSLILVICLYVPNPEIDIVSISIKDLSFGTDSPNPHLKAMVVISIRNINFRNFEFEDGELIFYYQRHEVLRQQISERRSIGGRETVILTAIEVKMDLDSKNSGFLDFTGVVEIRGWAKVTGKKQNKKSVLKRDMRLYLSFVM